MRKTSISAVLAVLSFGSAAGCADPQFPTRTAYGAESAPADAFPLIVTRRGGFAGVDDSARIAADGSAVVTRRGQQPVQISVPFGAMAALRGLLATPASATSATCNDGFEYKIVSPSANVAFHGCDAPGGQLATIATLLFKA